MRAICAQSHIWALDKLAPVEVALDEGTFGDPTLAELESAFRRALVEPDRRGVVLDGMGVHILWRNFGASLVVEAANPGTGDLLGAFLRSTIQLAFDAITVGPCRDGLARAAGYVGLELPLSEPIEVKPRAHVAMLGTPEERAELLSAIKKTSHDRAS